MGAFIAGLALVANLITVGVGPPTIHLEEPGGIAQATFHNRSEVAVTFSFQAYSDLTGRSVVATPDTAEVAPGGTVQVTADLPAGDDVWFLAATPTGAEGIGQVGVVPSVAAKVTVGNPAVAPPPTTTTTPIAGGPVEPVETGLTGWQLAWVALASLALGIALVLVPARRRRKEAKHLTTRS